MSAETKSSILEELTSMIHRLFPQELLNLTLEKQRISVGLYRLLAQGEPVELQTLAAAVSVPLRRVEAIIKNWPGVYCDKKRRFVGYWGLAIPQMSHKFSVDGRRLYTWCAWDSLFLPEILGKGADVESICPVTQDPIRLEVTTGGVERVEPATTVMSFVVPDPIKFQQNVLTSFCHYVHFFSSREAGQAWTSRHDGTFIVTLDQAVFLAQEKNRIQYRDVLSPRERLDRESS